jgi:putative membrane protein
MKGLLIRWVISAIALYITCLLGQALHLGLALNGVGRAFVVVVVLAVVNALIRPLVLLLTIPLNCLSLGLFTFVVNALMFWLVGSLDLGLVVKGFLPALFGSIAMMVISGLANQVVTPRE